MAGKIGVFWRRAKRGRDMFPNRAMFLVRALMPLYVVQPGVRESIALTYELERIWRHRATSASVDDGQLNKYALYRYVGTREGVYRVYPAIRVPIKFDPTKQTWSVTALCYYHKTHSILQQYMHFEVIKSWQKTARIVHSVVSEHMRVSFVDLWLNNS